MNAQYRNVESSSHELSHRKLSLVQQIRASRVVLARLNTGFSPGGNADTLISDEKTSGSEVVACW